MVISASAIEALIPKSSWLISIPNPLSRQSLRHSIYGIPSENLDSLIRYLEAFDPLQSRDSIPIFIRCIESILNHPQLWKIDFDLQQPTKTALSNCIEYLKSAQTNPTCFDQSVFKNTHLAALKKIQQDLLGPMEVAKGDITSLISKVLNLIAEPKKLKTLMTILESNSSDKPSQIQGWINGLSEAEKNKIFLGKETGLSRDEENSVANINLAINRCIQDSTDESYNTLLNLIKPCYESQLGALKQLETGLFEKIKTVSNRFMFEPIKLKELISILSAEAPTNEQINHWQAGLNHADKNKIFFGKNDLNADEQAIMDQINALLEACENVPPIDFADLKKLVLPLFNQQAGSIPQLMTSIQGMIQGVFKDFTQQQIKVKEMLDTFTSDIPEDIYAIRKGLVELASINTKEEQQKALKSLFQAYAKQKPNGVYTIDRALFSNKIFGSNDHQNKLVQFFSAIISIGEKVKNERISDSDTNEVIQALDCALKEKQGIVAQIKHQLLQLLDKEKIVAPHLLKELLIKLTLLQDQTHPREKDHSKLLLQQFQDNYKLESSDSQVIEDLIQSLDKNSSLKSESILAAQRVILKTLKPLQGAVFSIIDAAKVELADARIGVASTAVKSAIQSSQHELLKDLDLYFIEVWKAASLYSEKQSEKNYNSLKETIKKYKVNDNFTDFERTHLEKLPSIKEKDAFKEWFFELERFKNQRQGLIPQLFDTLEKKVQQLLKPIKSLLPFGSASDEGDGTTSPNHFKSLLTFIAEGSASSIQLVLMPLLHKIADWARTQQNSRELTTKFDSIIQKAEQTNFLDAGKRKEFIQYIQEQFEHGQILLINHFFAIPLFGKIQEVAELVELQKIMKSADENDIKKKITDWIEGFEGSIDDRNSFIQNKLFVKNPFHTATESMQKQFIEILNKIKAGDDLSTHIQSLRTLISDLFIDESDTSSNHLETAKKALDQPITKLVSQGHSIDNIKDQLTDNTSFFFVYRTISKWIGLDLDLSKFSEDHDKILAQYRRAGKRSSEQDLKKYQEDLTAIEYAGYTPKTFESIVAGLDSSTQEARKKSFIQTMVRLVDQSNASFASKKILKSSLPHIFQIYHSVIGYLVSKIIKLMQNINFPAFKVDESLNVEFIKTVSGFLNKIHKAYEEIPHKNDGQTISDYIKEVLKKDIYLGNQKKSIPELISLFNYLLVDSFMPEFNLSNYLNEISSIFSNDLNREFTDGNYGTLLMKSILWIPAYILTHLLRLFILYPLEQMFSYLTKNTIWKILDLSSTTQNLIDLAFQKLNQSTGLYNVIKKPLGNLIQEIDPDTIFASSSEDNEASSAILSQQSNAKNEINQMYQGFKTVLNWFENGKSLEQINALIKNGGPSPQGMISGLKDRFESAVLTDTIAEALIKGLLILTAPDSIEKISFNALNVTNSMILNLGHIESLTDLQKKDDENASFETKFSQIKLSFIRNISEKMLDRVISDLGTKQQRLIEKFFKEFKNSFSIIRQDLSSNQGFLCMPLEKINYLEGLRSILHSTILNYESKKQQILSDTSINPESLQAIHKKIIGVEKLIKDLAKSIQSELEDIKFRYELEYDSFNKLNTSLVELDKNLRSHFDLLLKKIDRDEQVETDLSEIDLELDRFKTLIDSFKYNSEPNSEIQISSRYQKVVDQYIDIYRKMTDHKTNCKKLYEKRILQNYIHSNINQLIFLKEATISNRDAPHYSHEQFNSLFNEFHSKIDQYCTLDETVLLKQKLNRFKLADNQDIAKNNLSGDRDSFKNKFDEIFSTIYNQATNAELNNFPDLLYILRIDTDPTNLFPEISQLIERVEEAVNKIKPIEIISLDLIERSGAKQLAKNKVAGILNGEIEKYKNLLNAPEFVETFFYNCILPEIIK